MPTDTELKTSIETELLNDDRLSSAPIHISVDHGVVKLEGTVVSFRRKLLAHEIASSYDGVLDVINELNVSPSGTVSDDEVLDMVRSSLEANAEISKSTITATSRGGHVTLSGNVGSHWERAVAEDVTRSIRGVRDVSNYLRVSLENKVSDKELGASIRAAFERTRGLGTADISVALNDEFVVLSGVVDALWKKQSAEAVVRRFGLLHIHNEIVVEG